MTISLHAFCKENSLSKSTVHRRCKLLGIDTANGLSADAQLQLRREFDLQDSRIPDVEGEIVSPQAGAITLACNTGIPAIPRFDGDQHSDVRDLAKVRGQQGQRNLEAYLQAMTGQYLHFKVAQHFAGIDAAFANAQQALSGQANQSVTNPGME